MCVGGGGGGGAGDKGIRGTPKLHKEGKQPLTIDPKVTMCMTDYTHSERTRIPY